jgi:WD40 repeat protein
MLMAARDPKLRRRIDRRLVMCGVACWLAGAVFLWMTLPPQPRATVATEQHSYRWLVGFSGDGKSFMTTGAAPWQHIDVRNTSDGQIRSRIDLGQLVTGPPTISSDGKLLAFPTKIPIQLKGRESTSNPMVIVWDVENNREIIRLDGADGPVAFAPDNRLIATRDASSMGSVLIWDLTDGTLSQRFTVSPGPILSLGFSPNGNHCVAVGQQLTPLLDLMSQFSGADGAPRRPTSPLLPSGGAVWWTTHDWQQAGQVPNDGRSLTSTAAGFATADRLALVRNDLPLLARLVDLKTGEEQLTVPIPPGASSLEPDITGGGTFGVLYYRNDVVAQVQNWLPASVTGANRRLYLPSTILYDAETGSVRARLPVDPRRAFISPDGQTLVAWDADKLSIWDVPPSGFTFIWAVLSAAITVPIITAVWYFIHRNRWAQERC